MWSLSLSLGLSSKFFGGLAGIVHSWASACARALTDACSHTLAAHTLAWTSPAPGWAVAESNPRAASAFSPACSTSPFALFPEHTRASERFASAAESSWAHLPLLSQSLELRTIPSSVPTRVVPWSPSISKFSARAMRLLDPKACTLPTVENHLLPHLLGTVTPWHSFLPHMFFPVARDPGKLSYLARPNMIPLLLGKGLGRAETWKALGF